MGWCLESSQQTPPSRHHHPKDPNYLSEYHWTDQNFANSPTSSRSYLIEQLQSQYAYAQTEIRTYRETLEEMKLENEEMRRSLTEVKSERDALLMLQRSFRGAVVEGENLFFEGGNCRDENKQEKKGWHDGNNSHITNTNNDENHANATGISSVHSDNNHNPAINEQIQKKLQEQLTSRLRVVERRNASLVTQLRDAQLDVEIERREKEVERCDKERIIEELRWIKTQVDFPGVNMPTLQQQQQQDDILLFLGPKESDDDNEHTLGDFGMFDPEVIGSIASSSATSFPLDEESEHGFNYNHVNSDIVHEDGIETLKTIMSKTIHETLECHFSGASLSAPTLDKNNSTKTTPESSNSSMSVVMEQVPTTPQPHQGRKIRRITFMKKT